MRILFASAEVAPWAKVGGLADVAGSLPKALARLGHEVAVAVPGYGFLVRDLKDAIVETRRGIALQINPWKTARFTLHRVDAGEFEVWLIDHDDRFAAVTKNVDLYSGSRDDYLTFCHGVLECGWITGFEPEIVHAHDWQMGFIPVLMREKDTRWSRAGACYTLHNFAHQGEFGADTIEAAGLQKSLFTYDRLETYGGVNFLKSGCVYADQINTVSPTYASEICSEEFGGRLHGLMQYLKSQRRLRGILNGIDTESHDPATDPCLPAHYNRDDLSGKEKCRAALLKELGLKAGKKNMVCGMISRLTAQKGFDMVIEGAEELLGMGCVLVLQSLGDPRLAAKLADIQRRHPHRFIHISDFNPPLAQRIYAGCDAFLMPSHFEPCGLGQMFAMSYGTVPIVRYTGGLADTVTEGISGFTFGPKRTEDFVLAMRRAVDAFADPADWRRLVRNGMSEDWSWDRSAPEYAEMYEAALALRRPDRVAAQAG